MIAVLLLVACAAVLTGYVIGDALGQLRGYDRGWLDSTLAAAAAERQETAGKEVRDGAAG